MKSLIDLSNEVPITFNPHGGTDRVTNETADEIERLSNAGFEIIVGNNPYMGKAKKWGGRTLHRISQVNSRTHGKCIRTIWAVK